MIEIRIHGRGGQGNVVAAYLLAAAGFDAGLYAQAFPAFGAERRGAPVTAFVRLARRPVLRRCAVAHPDVILVQDPLLLGEPATLAGIDRDTAVLANAGTNGTPAALARLEATTASLPATRIAVETIGRPLPNTPMLAAFLALTEVASIEALNEAIDERFAPPVAERNRAAVAASVAMVPAGAWSEVTDALGD